MSHESVGQRLAPTTIRRRATRAFVGRDEELAALVACLDRDAVVDAVPPAVVIEGEPGIGKSRLVTEALARCRTTPRLLRGRADELQRERPFGAITRALAPLEPHESDADARLLDLLSRSGTQERAPGPGLRGQIVDACLAVVRERVASGPVALVVEDLQWADAGTLAVLGEVLDATPVTGPALVATMRGGPRSRRLERLLGQLVPAAAVEISLTGLDPAESAALVAGLVGDRFGPRLDEHVGRAGGNPLFIVELLDALAEQGSLVAVGDGDGAMVDVEHSTLPPSLRITLLRRLSALPVPALETLRMAALLGSAFTVEDLGAVLDETPTRVVRLLREPMREGWIESAGARLCFRHDLVREALAADTPQAVRRALHRQIADRLLEQGRDVADVASHLLHGAQAPDPLAASRLREAGRSALSSEPAVAVELLGGAVRLDPTGPGRPAAELDLGLALLWAGHVEAGQATLRGVLERPHARELDVEAGLALARSCLLSGSTDEAVAVLARLADGATQDVERLRIEAERALTHVYRGELDQSWEAVTAVFDDEALAPDEARCLAQAVRASLWAIRGELVRAGEDGEAAVAIATHSHERETSRIPPQLLYASVLIDSDRLDDGWRQLGDARAVSEELGTAWVEPVQHLISARAQLFRGALDDAEAECETALRRSAEAGVRVMEAWGHAMIAMTRLHRLEIDGARTALLAGDEAVASAGHQVRGVDWLLWARARLAVAEGDPAAAHDLLAAVWLAHQDLGMRSERRLLGPDLVQLQLTVGDRAAAQQVADAVAEAAEVMGTTSARAAALHCRGLVDGLAEPLLAAAEATRGTALRLEHAGHCVAAGRGLADLGDRRAAIDLLEEGRQVAEVCRMLRTVREAEAALRALGVRRGVRGRRVRPQLGWDALTPTERQVVRLAAEGLTNPEIGEQLFISRRTVQTHLSHVYAKLQVSSRVELASLVAHQDELA
jgi:DNA-binding CsgD family transcriptional regulator